MVIEERVLGGRYRLQRKVASGAMGVVFEAEDVTLGRRVAVKLLSESLSSDNTFIERFRREARSAAALSHPNIASVFDYGEDEDSFYIVMELVEGNDLAEVLKAQGPLSPERATRIARQTADALGHAHAADLIHRDVKPANILIAAGDRVKVTDFGIARATSDMSLTATGSVMGTAHYLSPEQASGEPVSPRSDVYSLGIVLYEMLTGNVPFTGDNMVAIATRHASEDVPSLKESQPETADALDEVVRTATAKDPRSRFADGASMSRALQIDVSGAETAVMPGGAAGTQRLDAQPTRALPLPSDRWNTQRVGRVVVGVAALLLLISVAAGLARLLDRKDEPVTEASPRAGITASEPAADNAVAVPRGLLGMFFDDAQARLESEGFNVERSDVESEVPEEIVVDVTPPQGADVTEGATITLSVSKGPKTAAPDKKHGKDKGPKGPHGKGKGKKD
ncbi:MAG: eukaryotic-like serine/threonine-protein kinase [Actinomycetota bacterium]|nr:eukaryotic-like serine/threonine-protein kinase [Actinomycetota bacterium]